MFCYSHMSSTVFSLKNQGCALYTSACYIRINTVVRFSVLRSVSTNDM